MTAKLLLAEDSLTIQRVFELTLRQSGISLTVVDNGVDAIRLAKEITPDIVVADVSLPGKDGFEVAEALRYPESGGSYPVLILAGTLSPFDEERYRKCGADGVLFKPFESRELIEKVDALLRSREEPAPPPGDEEHALPSPEEPWDFSDVLAEMEEETQASAPHAAGAEELGLAAAAGEELARSALSLDDFDVSLEDVEGGPEPSREEARDDAAPPEVSEEEIFPIEEHFPGPDFDDSPSAVTDLSPAFETVEEAAGIDFLEEMAGVEGETPLPGVQAEEMAVSLSVSPEAGTHAGEGREELPSAAVEGGPPLGKEFREQFAVRAQEIFEKVAAESVEKVLWEVMEHLTKEFADKIRESVEAVAWEVIPATAETLIREEIARIREQAGKESS